MKKLLTLFTIVSVCDLCLLAISATAQTGGVYANSALIPRSEAPSQAEINFSVHHIPLDGFVLRTVSNTVYNVSQDKRWGMCEGEVYSKSGDYIIISYSTKNAWLKAIKNYPGDATDGMHIRCIALRSGTVDYNGTPLAAWDCGLPYHPPPPTQEQLKLAAIQRVNQYWNIERDHVREETKISLKHPPVSLDGTSSAEIDIVCYVNESHPAPDEINLIFNNVAEDWQYLRYSAFIINYDGEQKDFGELKVQGDVLPSGRVSEIMLANFTYDEFHKMAFSKKVMLDLGTQKNCQITPETRTQWQTLCNYFDLIKSQQKPKESDGTKVP